MQLFRYLCARKIQKNPHFSNKSNIVQWKNWLPHFQKLFIVLIILSNIRLVRFSSCLWSIVRLYTVMNCTNSFAGLRLLTLYDMYYRLWQFMTHTMLYDKFWWLVTTENSSFSHLTSLWKPFVLKILKTTKIWKACPIRLSFFELFLLLSWKMSSLQDLPGYLIIMHK